MPPASFEVEDRDGGKGRVGGIEVIELGWAGADGTVRLAPRMQSSAGQPPKYYGKLHNAMLEASPKWPEAVRLLEELDKWPRQRIIKDDLRSSAQRFFLLFHNAAGPPPRPSEIDSCARLLDRLLRENYDLETFPPLDAQNRSLSTKDYKGEWIKVRNRGQHNTGRITQIVKHGLCTTTKEMIFEAVVDVE